MVIEDRLAREDRWQNLLPNNRLQATAGGLGVARLERGRSPAAPGPERSADMRSVRPCA